MNTNNLRLFFAFLILFWGIQKHNYALTTPSKQYPSKFNIENEKFPKPAFKKDTSYAVLYRNKSILVKIALPEEQIDGVILLLPGWNLPVSDWDTKTTVCGQARSMNFALISVEMGKSVYMDSMYPSMRSDYKFYPTRTWLWDSVITPLQRYGWFTQGSASFVLGLSTGARGALILGLEHGTCIKAVAGLSGDYNPLLDTKDGLMVNTLGPYVQNEFRWKGTNNISLRSAEFKCHLFLAHGESDPVVPIAQTMDLWSHIEKKDVKKSTFSYNRGRFFTTFLDANFKERGSKKSSRKLNLVTVKNAKHDYEFWDFSGQLALDFFVNVR